MSDPHLAMMIDQFYAAASDPEGLEMFQTRYSNVKVGKPCGCLLNQPERSRFSLPYVIEHMNDKHRWSFLQIAEWLDTMKEVAPLRNKELST